MESEGNKPKVYRVVELGVSEDGEYFFHVDKIPPFSVWVNYKDDVVVDNRADDPLTVNQTYRLVSGEKEDPKAFVKMVCEIEKSTDGIHHYKIKVYGRRLKS